MAPASEGETELRQRVHQQKIVAELGQEALETEALDRLLRDASDAVANTLDTEYTGVLESRPDGDEVILRQGVGWRDGLVGSATVPVDRDSQVGCALRSEQPVIVGDLRTEERFSDPELPTSHDVVSGISAAIGSVDEPWGVLTSHTTERREFTEHDANFVQSVANILASAIDRHRRELEYDEQRERYRRLLQVSPAAIAIFGADGRILYANRAAADRADVDRPEDLLGHQALEFVHPDDRAEIADRIHRVIKERKTTPRREMKFVTSDGEVKHMTVTTAPITYHGEPAGQVVLNDITERKEYQQKLEESNERLEQFASAASHDLQEPLRMISNYLQLIKRRYTENFDEDGEEFLEFAVDGAERMREMITGLLEYSRVETKGDPFEPVDLDAVLADVRENLQVSVVETDAEIRAESLPTVEGDDSQLHQLFQNLLSNAIEYSGDEPPRVTVSAHRDGGKWRISVHDEGIGIDGEDGDRVFEVFQRLHTRDEHAGTGIGLALCKRIVERHDGEIWVDSVPGDGATFSVTLPAADSCNV